MRSILIAASLLALTAPAFAQEASDTLKVMTVKGNILSVQGMDIDVKYTPDGKFTAMDGQVTGTWKIQGDKLCTTSNFAPDEDCVVYPAGKKSGDSFEVTGKNGSATVKIK